MAKFVRYYSANELAGMIASGNRSAVETIVKRQAERYNKQITRAKTRGKSLVSVGGSKRVNVNVGKLTPAQLVEQYTQTQKRFGVGETETFNGDIYEIRGTGGATKQGLLKNDELMKNDLAQIFGYDLTNDKDKKRFDEWLKRHYNNLSDEQKEKVYKRVQEIKDTLNANIDKLWYHDATRVVYTPESGIESMSNLDLQNSKLDYATRGLPTYLYNLHRRIKARSKQK